ncbi:hypothetical protein SEA_GIANTSBANE_87 [Arthrobacter phage Giantsbane]|nr:hypothetical protein SEA_GIANTSBANE_87 [Arthrobacter phage Giantsbane]
MSLSPEAKVTIIVEGMEDVTTIVIPLAANVTFGKGNVEGGTPHEHYLALSCYGFYDIDQNIVYTQETRPRHIPQEESVDTTAINIVKGEN